MNGSAFTAFNFQREIIASAILVVNCGDTVNQDVKGRCGTKL
mgnify:FL=1